MNINAITRLIRIALPATLLFVAQSAISQTVLNADCGKDGAVRITYTNGKTKTIPSDEQQVGCDRIGVANDRHTVAWEVLIDNCCTTYPIPISVIVHRDGNKVELNTGQMVWDWSFNGQGERIAVLTGPVHGGASEANLYNSSTGKVLASWDGKGEAPAWATKWRDEFAP